MDNDLERCNRTVSLPGLSLSRMTKKTVAGGCSLIYCPPMPCASSATSPRLILPVCGGGAPAVVGEEEDNSDVPLSSPLNAAVVSDPSNVAIREQGQDAGPTMMVSTPGWGAAGLIFSFVSVGA